MELIRAFVWAFVYKQFLEAVACTIAWQQVCFFVAA